MSNQSAVGILAFQGDVSEHVQVLTLLKTQSIEVRTLEDLKKVDRLIIPGGESTVMARFLKLSSLDKEIVSRAKKGMPIFGTCAGAILLAKKVKGKNAPETLRLIDIEADRNAYGAQIDSFEANVMVKGIKKAVPVSFIRAPIITRVGKNVDVMASHKGHPVLVRQGNILASTCHPEARGSTDIHAMFLKM